ncbi:MAG: gliding motility lipoprotein GldH [Bacteroides sp.]|nr:gliding motility lipoprotein GldH [Bacteroides sp.]
MRKHRPIINWTSWLIVILLLTVSCQDNTIYHSFQPVNATGWNKSDTLFYSLPEAIISSSYQYEIGVRHKDSYKYRDIWLTINQDTIHLYLADSIGNWEGNGIGEMRQLTFPVQLNLSTQDSIKEFCITHIMQDNPIYGIHDIGIRIRKQP